MATLPVIIQHWSLFVDDAPAQRNYLKLRDFVRMCPVSESTIRRWIKAGILEHEQPGGRDTAILIPADAIEQVQSHATEPSESAQSDQGRGKAISGPQPRWQTRHLR